MSSFFNLRVLASAFACASVAAVGSSMPAFAQDRTVWLQDNEQTTITGYFLQGENISANCDADCMDLDLFLYNEMGAMVDSDDAVDAYPIVTAPYDGTFQIQVSMPSCTHMAGCSVAVSSEYGF